MRSLPKQTYCNTWSGALFTVAGEDAIKQMDALPFWKKTKSKHQMTGRKA